MIKRAIVFALFVAACGDPAYRPTDEDWDSDRQADEKADYQTADVEAMPDAAPSSELQPSADEQAPMCPELPRCAPPVIVGGRCLYTACQPSGEPLRPRP